MKWSSPKWSPGTMRPFSHFAAAFGVPPLGGDHPGFRGADRQPADTQGSQRRPGPQPSAGIAAGRETFRLFVIYEKYPN